VSSCRTHRVSIPGSGRSTPSDWFWSQSRLPFTDNREHFHQVNSGRRVKVTTHLQSAEVADAWSYTSIPPYAAYLLSSSRRYGPSRWPLLFVCCTQDGGSCTSPSKAQLCLPVLLLPQLCTQGGDPVTQRHVPEDRSALSWSSSCAPLEDIRGWGWGGGMNPLIINL
jgi:hypothetical protein